MAIADVENEVSLSDYIKGHHNKRAQIAWDYLLMNDQKIKLGRKLSIFLADSLDFKSALSNVRVGRSRTRFVGAILGCAPNVRYILTLLQNDDADIAYVRHAIQVFNGRSLVFFLNQIMRTDHKDELTANYQTAFTEALDCLSVDNGLYLKAYFESLKCKQKIFSFKENLQTFLNESDFVCNQLQLGCSEKINLMQKILKKM